MEMPGRVFQGSTSYRVGFNGMEHDNELKGSDNSYDFGARIQDPRLGRFLSLDPRSREFVWLSPYAFAADEPIRFIDEEGKGVGDRVVAEPSTINVGDFRTWVIKPGTVTQKIPHSSEILHNVEKSSSEGGFASRVFFDTYNNIKGGGVLNIYFTDKGMSYTYFLEGKKFTVTGEQLELDRAKKEALNVYWGDVFSQFVTNLGFIAGHATMMAMPGGSEADGSLYNESKMATIFEDVSIAKTASSASGIIFRDQAALGHIFTKAHNLENTEANQSILLKLVNDSKNKLGLDEFGNSWYGKTLANGEQYWAEVRNGKIFDGGKNLKPRQFNSKTGLSNEVVPNKKGQ